MTEINLYNGISICIPTYEMYGKGVEYLTILLDSILAQSTKSYEVIISDQSDNNDILNLIQSYKSKMDISYYKCDNKGKSSYNINNAIKYAKYDIIKPMFQDDFFIDSNCIKCILDTPNITWGAIINKRYDKYGKCTCKSPTPKYNNGVKYGHNSISCPSIIFFKNDNNFFKNDLVWLMDCELYERLYQKYGNFITIPIYGVGVRIWKDSYTYHISQDTKNKEIKNVKPTLT